MKKKLYIIIVLLFTLNAKSQVTDRVLEFNAQVITELNEPLIAAIDRHIKVSKARKIKNPNDFFILVSIFPYIKEWEVPKPIFDSIYAINDFKTIFPSDSITPAYSISIVLACKRFYTDGWMGFGRKNTYYYKHGKYELLLNSYLDLIFENKSEMQHIILQLQFTQESTTLKPYNIWTGYHMWNRYITEIRFKDLISPSWTGKRDDFK